MVAEVRSEIESEDQNYDLFSYLAQAPSLTVAPEESYGTLNRVRYLSDEWITEADRQVKGLTPLASELAIKYDVTNGPDGDRSYCVIFGPDEMSAVPTHPNVDVTLSLTWENATAIATGSMSAQRAFLDGTMSLSGDAATLVGHQETLKNVTDVLANLRGTTEYT